MIRKMLLSLLFFIGLTALLNVPAKADGIIIPEPPICDPCPIPSPMSQLVIRYHHVSVEIDDQVATTHVDQVFYNPNDWAVEGEYVFPIPIDAAVSDFILWVDGEAVHGEVLDAEQARRTYEEIVATLRDPALLEYTEMGALKARVFPIPPQGERRIELEYNQALNADSGLIRYLYPLATEKFSMEPLESVSISVSINSSLPIRAVYSPSHPISIDRDGRNNVLVGYEENDVLPDNDFTLFFSTGESEAFHLMTYRDPASIDDPDGFFLLLLAPGFQESIRILPKDVLLVLDRSGSMDGEKFRQAQQALRYVINQLNPEDRFNIITFSTGVEIYADELQAASEKQDALLWVDELHAEGSTDINRALLEAASLAGRQRPTYLVFLTDGLPTEGEVDNQQIIDNLKKSAQGNLSLFTFGVGYDVDTFLLDSLVENHHGSSTYVTPGEKLDEVLSTFYNKINAPILTNINLDFGQLGVYDIYPDPLPDLFVGSQIVIAGRYRQGGITDVILNGLVNGQSKELIFQDQEFSKMTSDWNKAEKSLPRLWATRKIGYLLKQIRLDGPSQETIDQIVHLSIRYGIITPYTSYLVSEPSPLGIEEQERIASEQYDSFLEEASEPTFGRQAVEKAEGQGMLANAESVASPSIEAEGKVRVVGSHTFVNSEGSWVDTMFDPDHMETEKVNFLSEIYFDLAASTPELASAFSLGSDVIVVLGDIVYEVIGDESGTELITETTIIPTPEPDSHPTQQSTQPQTTQSIASTVGQNSISVLPCMGGLIITMFPLLVLSLVTFSKYDHKGS